MNTPSHVIFNLLALGRNQRSQSVILPLVVGGFLPDIPIFVLYVVEKIIRHTPDAVIWQQTYYSDFWQNWINALHSFPLDLMGIGLALWLKSQWAVLFLSSMTLHALADFFVHNDDAHQHFFPFSHWRFFSPISYWDPRHYGQIMAPLELISVILGCIFLGKTYQSKAAKFAIASLGILYSGLLLVIMIFWLGSH